jgi:hypothetical protein
MSASFPQLCAQSHQFWWTQETSHLVRLRLLHVPTYIYRILFLVITPVTRTSIVTALNMAHTYENL